MSGSALALQRRIQVLCADLLETERALTRGICNDERTTTMLDLPISAPRREPDEPSPRASKGTGSSAPHSADPWAEANDLADRTRGAAAAEAAIMRPGDSEARAAKYADALARLDSDLASMRDALDGLAEHCDEPGANCSTCADDEPCRDEIRYARQRDRALTELDRTAAYGVTQ